MKTGESVDPPDQVIALDPRAATAIRKLFGEDEAFRELCGDYADCAAMIEQMRRGQGKVDERVGQYCELRVNLENELLAWISRTSEAPGPPAREGDPASHHHPSDPAFGDRAEKHSPNP